MATWHPTDDDLRAILARGADALARRHPKVDWVELSVGARNLEPPDDAGYVMVGWIVAVGEVGRDVEVWWHPGKAEGRLRRQR